MKFKFRTALILSIGFLSGLMAFFSCDSSFSSQEKMKAFDNALFKAKNYAAENSDSCLIYADSALKIALRYNFEDSLLITCYDLRSQFFSTIRKPDSSLANQEKIFQIAKANQDSSLFAAYYRKTGEIYIKLQKLDLALNNLSLSLNLFTRLGMEYESVLVKIKIGEVLNYEGDFERSQKYLMEAYQWLDQNNRAENISTVCINVGNNFAAIGSHHEAIDYYRMASQYALNQKEYYNSASALNNVGISFRYINPDSALFYYRKALLVLKEVGENDLEIIIRYNMANVFVKKNDYINAAAFYDSVLLICTERKIPDGVARSYSSKAMLAEKEGAVPKSVNYLHKAISIADSIGNNNLKLALMNQLYQVLRDNGNFMESSAMSDKIMALKDSIMTSEKQIAIHRIEQQYQSEKKEQENKNLKAELKSEEIRLQYRLVIIVIMIIALLALAVFSIITHRLSKERTLAYSVLLGKYEKEKKYPSFPYFNSDYVLIDESGATSSQDGTIAQIDKIYEYFRTEKPHLDPKLKVEQVADALNISYKMINNVIKEAGEQSFNSLVNRYRIESAKNMFEDARYNSYTIEAIANKAGFGTKQSFYNAFEQFTGIKPSFYRNYMNDRSGKVNQDQPV